MLQLSYPGVYIEELPTGQHTITGVATSITTFLGRALWGPVDEPTTVFSFSDYERLFGGLAYDYPLSYAVQDFFLNGGSQAIIVRLVHVKITTDTNGKITATQDTSKSAALVLQPAATGSTPAGGNAPAGDNAPTNASSLQFVAANPGSWANTAASTGSGSNSNGGPSYGLKVVATQANAASAQELVGNQGKYSRYGLTADDLFNLAITFTKPDGSTITEQYLNLTTKDGRTPGASNPNRVDRVLHDQSQLVMVDPAIITNLNSLPTPSNNTWSGAPIDSNGAGADGDKLDYNDYHRGLATLETVDLFNLMCIPLESFDESFYTSEYKLTCAEAAVYCTERRAILIVEPPQTWVESASKNQFEAIDPVYIGLGGPVARNAAVYFPRVKKADPEMQGITRVFSACGIIAGVIASTDLQRGVWKAPAGQDAALLGIQDLETRLSDKQNGVLNQKGINCLRSFPIIGPVVWGARTLRGADQLTDDYKYLPVRRLTLYIEESLYRGTKWAVFEPNNETLWSSLRLNVGAFMADLARQGAFYDYRVVCDKTTTTQYDIDRGIVKVLVAFAPVKPAEFVVLQIQQQAGQQPV